MYGYELIFSLDGVEICGNSVTLLTQHGSIREMKDITSKSLKVSSKRAFLYELLLGLAICVTLFI